MLTIILISYIIGFSINGLCTENFPLSQRNKIPYKIKVNLLIW